MVRGGLAPEPDSCAPRSSGMYATNCFFPTRQVRADFKNRPPGNLLGVPPRARPLCRSQFNMTGQELRS
eukprot:905488-Pyramimonas_sp.AAC.1